jgi:hypothetical protein
MHKAINMKMDKVANSGNDEFYTPKYAVQPIIKYLKLNGFQKVWCPFDTQQSWFVQLLEKDGFSVTISHINNHGNFFELEPPNCDCIVSNPPYSIKGQILEKLFKLQIPFAMLVGIVGLFESQDRFNMFKNNKFEILYLDKRVAYFKDYNDQKPSLNPPFSSVYVCSQILPQQICFESINKKDF